MLKKSLALLFAAVLGFHIFTITAYCGEMPSLSAASAVLITADTKDVLYSKSPNEKRPVASTTKIMTALLAVEYGELQKKAIADTFGGRHFAAMPILPRAPFRAMLARFVSL